MLSHKFISPIRVSLITNTIRRDSFPFLPPSSRYPPPGRFHFFLFLFYLPSSAPPPPRRPLFFRRSLFVRGESVVAAAMFASRNFIRRGAFKNRTPYRGPARARCRLDIKRGHFTPRAFLETQAVISFTAKRLAEPERLLTAFRLREAAAPLPPYSSLSFASFFHLRRVLSRTLHLLSRIQPSPSLFRSAPLVSVASFSREKPPTES